MEACMQQAILGSVGKSPMLYVTIMYCIKDLAV